MKSFNYHDENGRAVDPVKLATDVKHALYELTSETKNSRALASDTRQNLEDFMQKYERFSAALSRHLAQAEREREEIASAMHLIGAKSRGGIGHNGGPSMTLADEIACRDNPEYKNFFGWMAFHSGKKDSIDLDLKTLRTDSETQGAYLIPQVMDNTIRKNITEISPVRLYARNRLSASKSMDIPRRLSLPVAQFEGEAEQDEQDVATYGSETVTLFRQSITIPATLDMMVSSAFDLEREIASDVGEAFGQGEGRAFVIGTGHKGPQGVMTDTRIEVRDTATTGEVDFGDLADMAGRLKRGQAPMWFMNRRTLAKMWQIKSSIGVPIWAPVSGSNPATIFGFPYSADMIDLDDAQTGAGAKPLIFGDMRRGYEIFDMLGISVIRDDLTKKRQAITEWTFRRYLTGRVIIPEAFKIMRVKA